MCRVKARWNGKKPFWITVASFACIIPACLWDEAQAYIHGKTFSWNTVEWSHFSWYHNREHQYRHQFNISFFPFKGQFTSSTKKKNPHLPLVLHWTSLIPVSQNSVTYIRGDSVFKFFFCGAYSKINQSAATSPSFQCSSYSSLPSGLFVNCKLVYTEEIKILVKVKDGFCMSAQNYQNVRPDLLCSHYLTTQPKFGSKLEPNSKNGKYGVQFFLEPMLCMSFARMRNQCYKLQHCVWKMERSKRLTSL